MRPDTYITDLGGPVEMVPDDGSPPVNIGRYGVWKRNPARKRMEVVDTGDDLEALRERYGPCELVPLPFVPR